MPAKSKHVEERVRDVRLMWERDPKGPILHRDRAPPGLRTPNGLVWGHQLGHLFWIQRIPGANALTIWSRSMIRAHGEGYEETEWDEPLVEPRIRRPWPVLTRVPRNGKSEELPTIHPPDRGCNLEHPELRPPPEGWTRDNVVLPPMFLEYFGECPDDPTETCTGPLLYNSALLKNSKGELYDYVWCPHFRKNIAVETAMSSHPVFPSIVSETGAFQLVQDSFGICVYVPIEPSKAAPGEDAETKPGSAVTSDADVPVTDASGASVKDDTFSEAPAMNDTSQSTIRGVSPETANPRNPFLVDDLPKLEEFIPDEFLPDVLMVHDPDNTTHSVVAGGTKPIKYQRIFPKYKLSDIRPERDWLEREEPPREENVAHLYLSKKNRFGSGNHSYVYRAPLTLPAPLSARSPSGQVTVAAKLAYNRCTAHGLLHNEARVYQQLPKNAMEDWCGYDIVPQCRFPVPVSAIAPKFFGYYLPVDAYGNIQEKKHHGCSEERPCTVDWASPILLMEECGQPVEPHKFTADQRTECFSLILRLHHMDIVQGSFYVRNIMCQPGPLTLPPKERSYDTPSFRIIDFGRGKCWEWDVGAPDRDPRRFEFARRVGDEVARARTELLVHDLGY